MKFEQCKETLDMNFFLGRAPYADCCKLRACEEHDATWRILGFISPAQTSRPAIITGESHPMAGRGEDSHSCFSQV